MKWLQSTFVHMSASLALVVYTACTTVEAPQPTTNHVVTTSQKPDAVAPRAHAEEDAAVDAEADEEDDDDKPRERVKSRVAHRTVPDAGDAGDAGKHKKPDGGSRQKPDAGDAGNDAGVSDCDKYREENSDVDAFDCEQFQSEECDSHALEVCESFHFMMNHGVFVAFVECLADTPGVDWCGEDQSTVSECAAAAKAGAKACAIHQIACEAYESCETMSVEDCDKSVAIYGTTAIGLVSDLYACDIEPTYFFEE